VYYLFFAFFDYIVLYFRIIRFRFLLLPFCALAYAIAILLPLPLFFYLLLAPIIIDMHYALAYERTPNCTYIQVI